MFQSISFPVYRQLDQMDCGPTCLKIIAKHYGKQLDLEYLRQHANIQRDGVSFSGLINALETFGFRGMGIQSSIRELIDDVPLPAIAHWDQKHFVVVYKTTKTKVYVSDPALGLVSYPHKTFQEHWGADGTGVLLLIEPTQNFNLNQEEGTSPKSLHFLLGYIRPYKKFIGQLLLSLFLASVIQLLLPFLTQSLVDYGINYNDLNFIHLIVIAQIFLFLTRSVSSVLREWILLHVSIRVNIAMITDFLDKLLKLHLSYFDSKTTGDFMQRIYDHHRIDEFLSGRSLSIIFDVLSILIFGMVLLYFDTAVFVVFSIGTVLFIGWSLAFLKRKALLDHQLFKLNHKDQSLLIQLITGIRDIKLNGSEQRRQTEWKQVQNKLFELHIKLLKVDQAQLKGGTFLYELMGIGIIFLSAKAVVSGEMTLGTMLAIQFIVGSLAIPISNTVEFIVILQKALLSFNRLAEIHGQKEESQALDDIKTIIPGTIQIKDLVFGYGEQASVLNQINFKLPYRKTTALVGASGSGKTTLLKLLLKLYDPKSGHIKIEGEDLKYIDAQSWRQKCGVVLQDSALFKDTFERNITESLSHEPTDRKRLEHAVSMTNLTDLLASLPLGLQTLIDEKGNNLSGGEKQRVLIARAIYKNPEYLFFDEATSALDAENEKVITQNMQDYYKNRTVLIVAHRLSTVKQADQILVMDKGQIVEQGNHIELVAQKGIYHTLIMNQL